MKRVFLTERINQFDMRNHLFFGKENCHNLWNMITNDVIYKDKRGNVGDKFKEEDC